MSHLYREVLDGKKTQMLMLRLLALDRFRMLSITASWPLTRTARLNSNTDDEPGRIC